MALELRTLMTMLHPSHLQRNFLMGRLLRLHLARLTSPSNCHHAHVRGVGLLVYAGGFNLSKGPSGIDYVHDRLILPHNITLSEIKAHMQVSSSCADCSGGSARPAQRESRTRSRPVPAAAKQMCNKDQEVVRESVEFDTMDCAGRLGIRFE